MRNANLGLLVAALTACSSGGVTDSAGPTPRDSTPTPPPGGTVQRASLTAQVTIDPADAALAAAVGLAPAGLTVRLLRDGTPATSATAVTTAAGTVRFDNLLEGRYSLTVERELSAAERDRLPASDRDATVFAGGASVIVSPPQAATGAIPLVASRRGSLVISEQYGYTGSGWLYNWGMYMEFYNNSDTTVYMDGMLLVRTSVRLIGPLPWGACEDPTYARYRRDTTRLWVENGIRFPGTGRDYPVPPGAARVYAQDAVNHIVASGSDRYLDLSAAHFEHVANDGDTDSPLAANVTPIFGTTTGSGGRGLRTDGQTNWILARSSAWDRVQQVTLTRTRPQAPGEVAGTGEFTLYGVPREDILDIMSLDGSPAYRAYMATTTFGDVPPCPPVLEAVYDRAPAPVSDSRVPEAARRRTIGRTPEGRAILMRTRTSARDIEATTRLRERFP
jgi:hypothetical protein